MACIKTRVRTVAMLAGETLDLLRTAAAAAADKKAFQVVCLEVADLTSYADGFLLCSAASDRQVGAGDVRRAGGEQERHRFRDFFRLGMVLNLVVWIGAAALIPRYWAF